MSDNLLHELRVPVSKAAAMRYLLETVEHGYCHHIAGRLPAAKVAGFAVKMAERYGVMASRGARAYARECGRAAARLVLYPLAESGSSGEWCYYLLATEGTGAIREQERLLDARKPGERLAWSAHYQGLGWCAQYELVGRPVQSRARGLVHRWTWLMTPTLYQHMRDWVEVGAGRVRSSRDKDGSRLASAVEALRRMPGFSGVRSQKRALLRAANLPRVHWAGLELSNIGPYVDKCLPVFAENRTVASLLAAPAPAAADA